MSDQLTTDTGISAEATSGRFAYIVSTTRPDEILRHDISDEELGMLGDLRRDYLWEGTWVALGIAGGSLPSGISGLWHYAKSESVPFDEFVQVLLFVAGTTAFLILRHAMKSKSGTARDLVTAIKERTKHSVTGQIAQS